MTWKSVVSRRNAVWNKTKRSLKSVVLLPMGNYQVWLVKKGD